MFDEGEQIHTCIETLIVWNIMQKHEQYASETGPDIGKKMSESVLHTLD